MSYNNGPKIITDQLILLLDAKNNKSYPGTGSSWNNLISTSYTATKAGSQSPTYPQYNSNGYFSFNGGILGTNYSRFDISNIPSFSSLSIFAWYRTSLIDNSWQTILRMDNSDFELSLNNANSLYYAAGTNYNDINCTFSSSKATDGIWHYMGLTFDGINLLAYFDGTQVSSQIRGSSTTTAAGTLRVGTRDDAYTQHFVGDIANISIYTKILTSSEVLQNYNALKGRFSL